MATTCRAMVQHFLKVTPFEALYAYKPPQICEFTLTSPLSPEARMKISEREKMMQTNLEHAQSRIKYFADRKRTKEVLRLEIWST